MPSINLGLETRFSDRRNLKNAIREAGGSCVEIQGVILAEFDKISLQFSRSRDGNYQVMASSDIDGDRIPDIELSANGLLDDIQVAYTRNNFRLGYQKIKQEHRMSINYSKKW